MKKILLFSAILFSLMNIAAGTNCKNELKHAVYTQQAPSPIGTYSQAIQVGNVVYLSGQIALDPHTDKLAAGIEQQVDQAFKNLDAVANAAGGNLSQIVKINVYLTDINNISFVNATMAKYFPKPYPARSTVQVSALAKGAAIEVEGIIVVNCSDKQRKQI